MEVKIQISDEVYAKMLNGSTRVRGSIALVNPKEGNFNAHRKSPVTSARKFMKLPHGRVSMNDTDVSMYLKIAYTERLSPARTIEAESSMASSFINLINELN